MYNDPGIRQSLPANRFRHETPVLDRQCSIKVLSVSYPPFGARFLAVVLPGRCYPGPLAGSGIFSSR